MARLSYYLAKGMDLARSLGKAQGTKWTAGAGAGIWAAAAIFSAAMNTYNNLDFDKGLPAFLNETFNVTSAGTPGRCYYRAPDKELHVTFTELKNGRLIAALKHTTPLVEEDAVVHDLGVLPYFAEASCDSLKEDKKLDSRQVKIAALEAITEFYNSKKVKEVQSALESGMGTFQAKIVAAGP